MSKIRMVEALVKKVLEIDPEARKDDFRLIAQVYFYYNDEIGKLPFNIVMLGHKELRLPSVESITRARRKVQAEHENLKADKKTEKIRINEELEYRRYSKEHDRKTKDII